jgi:uncharacterized protein
MAKKDYVIRVMTSPLQVDAAAWNALLALQTPGEAPSPFMRHEYLAAMHESGSAIPKTGWTPHFITLWHGDALAGACALYLKIHSYGEYVFDWAWANAYAEHGLKYYPKALIAPPFTPVPGARLLARNAAERLLLVQAVTAWCEEEKLSSLHLLFASDEDVAACEEAGLMLRHNVQFHWSNAPPRSLASRSSLPPEGALRLRSGKASPAAPTGEDAAPTLVASRTALAPEEAAAPAVWQSQSRGPDLKGIGSGPELLALPLGEGGGEGSPHPAGYRDFDDFLMSLSQEKRKKIRQERRKVFDAGIVFRWALGSDITDADWDFFYKCYERTYYEHGNAPYLSRDFFRRMQRNMPENWLLFVGEHVGKDGKKQPIATSLIAVSANNGAPTLATSCASLPPGGSELARGGPSLRSLPLADTAASDRVAYGRYWGAVARVDCLHFEACYYQPLQWCIDHGYQRFEGGAQGEHKMARALLPVKTTSAHWLAHPSFADAVERFLEREGEGIERYMDELEKRSPIRQAGPNNVGNANATLSNK